MGYHELVERVNIPRKRATRGKFINHITVARKYIVLRLAHGHSDPCVCVFFDKLNGMPLAKRESQLVRRTKDF